jgi:hypothetical protein
VWTTTLSWATTWTTTTGAIYFCTSSADADPYGDFKKNPLFWTGGYLGWYIAFKERRYVVRTDPSGETHIVGKRTDFERKATNFAAVGVFVLWSLF